MDMYTETKDGIKIYMDWGSTTHKPGEHGGVGTRGQILYFKLSEEEGATWYRVDSFFYGNSAIGFRQHIEKRTFDELLGHIYRKAAGETL